MSFVADLSRFGQNVKQRANEVVGDVVVQCAGAVDRRSPVGDAKYWKNPPPKGYVGGAFRGAWQLGVNEQPTADVFSIDPSGSVTQGRIIAAIPEEAAGKVYYLVNNRPYGPALEEGHSRQAPQGIIGLTAIEFPQMVDQAVGALR